METIYKLTAAKLKTLPSDVVMGKKSNQVYLQLDNQKHSKISWLNVWE